MSSTALFFVTLLAVCFLLAAGDVFSLTEAIAAHPVPKKVGAHAHPKKDGAQALPKKIANPDAFYDFARFCRKEGQKCRRNKQCCSGRCMGKPANVCIG